MRTLKLAFLTAVTASSLAAQTYNYPALQTPRIVDREYNFAAATAGNAGTSLVFQWREGLNEDWQFSLDGGLAAPKGSGNDTRLLLGGGLAWQWLRANADIPFDLALTGGAGFSAGNGFNVVRIPFGAVAGHTFTLDNDMRAHAVRASAALDRPLRRLRCGTTTKLDVDVDIGVNYEITQQVALRIAGLLGRHFVRFGSTNALGFSVAWTPKGLKKF